MIYGICETFLANNLINFCYYITIINESWNVDDITILAIYTFFFLVMFMYRY